MASLQKTIEIIFNATDNVSPELAELDRTLSGFAGSIEGASQPFADLAKNILAVESAIGVLSAATLAYAHNEAAALEDAQAGLNKVLGDSEGTATDYAQAIKEISLQFGVAGESTTETVAGFKQAGFSISESLSLIDVALTGVKIAELSAEEAGQLLIQNIRGIGAEASDAAHFMDAWNEVSNNYAVTAKELAIATGELAPIAKTAGLSFDELVGLVTPMIEVLGSGSEAATALKVSLATLNTEEKRVVDTLKSLGIAQRDANGDMKASGDILAEIGKIWPELTESQQANYAIQLFGKEQYARMSIVLNDYDKVLKVTTVSEKAAGSAKEELAVAMNKSSVAADRFAVAFGYAAAAVGGQFLTESTNVVNSLTTLASAFDKTVSDGGLAPLFNYLNPLLDEFAANIDLIAHNLPAAFDGVDFTKLINSFKSLGLEFGNVFEGIDLTSVEGLEDALQIIIDGLASLNHAFAGVIDGFGPVIEVFKTLGASAAESDGELANFAGQVIGMGATINTFSGWIGGLTSVFSALSDGIIILAGVNALGMLPAAFTSASTSAGSLTTALGKGGLLGASAAVGAAWGNMVYELAKGNQTFTDIADSVFNMIPGLDASGKSIEDQARSWIKLIPGVDLAVQAYDALAGSSDDMVQSADSIVESVDDIVESTDDMTESTKSYEDIVNDMAAASDIAATAIDETADSIEESSRVTKVAAGEFEGWYKVIDNGIEVFYKSKSAAEDSLEPIKDVVDTEKELAETSKEAAEAAAKLALEYSKLEADLESIASNERIKSMELKVDFQIAELEADTERFKSALESIADVYEATTDLIGEMWEGLGSGDLSRMQELDLESSIDKQEKLQKDQWDTKKKLIEAQIAQIESATKRAESGAADIVVDGGDLQPELEAIMQSLFKSIRIKMSADYENFLLGLPS